MEEKNIKQLAVPITKKNIGIGKKYNKEALEGMLNFLEALYEDLMNDIKKEGISPLEAIKSELTEIKRLKKVWL
jgi:hypothetical protein